MSTGGDVVIEKSYFEADAVDSLSRQGEIEWLWDLYSLETDNEDASSSGSGLSTHLTLVPLVSDTKEREQGSEGLCQRTKLEAREGGKSHFLGSCSDAPRSREHQSHTATNLSHDKTTRHTIDNGMWAPSGQTVLSDINYKSPAQ